MSRLASLRSNARDPLFTCTAIAAVAVLGIFIYSLIHTAQEGAHGEQYVGSVVLAFLSVLHYASCLVRWNSWKEAIWAASFRNGVMGFNVLFILGWIVLAGLSPRTICWSVVPIVCNLAMLTIVVLQQWGWYRGAVSGFFKPSRIERRTFGQLGSGRRRTDRDVELGGALKEATMGVRAEDDEQIREVAPRVTNNSKDRGRRSTQSLDLVLPELPRVATADSNTPPRTPLTELRHAIAHGSWSPVNSRPHSQASSGSIQSPPLKWPPRPLSNLNPLFRPDPKHTRAVLNEQRSPNSPGRVRAAFMDLNRSRSQRNRVAAAESPTIPKVIDRLSWSTRSAHSRSASAAELQIPERAARPLSRLGHYSTNVLYDLNFPNVDSPVSLGPEQSLDPMSPRSGSMGPDTPLFPMSPASFEAEEEEEERGPPEIIRTLATLSEPYSEHFLPATPSPMETLTPDASLFSGTQRSATDTLPTPLSTLQIGGCCMSEPHLAVATLDSPGTSRFKERFSVLPLGEDEKATDAGDVRLRCMSLQGPG